MADWLAARGVPDAHLLAATFVERGAGTAELVAATAGVPTERLAPTRAWIEAALAAATPVEGIEHAAGHMSELVGAVKAYTHTDRAAERGPVDVRAGLGSTLAMFAHRVRDRGLTKDVGEGTGLGLDIARRIVVAQHEGTLDVTSTPGDTRFTVRLPLSPQDHRDPGAAAGRGPPARAPALLRPQRAC